MTIRAESPPSTSASAGHQRRSSLAWTASSRSQRLACSSLDVNWVCSFLSHCANTGPDSPFSRLLLHPHENEQPFTRSQSGIVIPAGVTQVRVRAHDLVDGFGGREVLVDLTLASGEGFEVERSE